MINGLGHKCKSAKLFLLEGVEIVPALGVQITEMEEEGMKGVIKSQDERIEEAEITLYALVGSPTPGTMMVNGMILGEGLIILLDSGIAHNFIDAALLPKLQLSVDVTQILEVKVANGDGIKT